MGLEDVKNEILNKAKQEAKEILDKEDLTNKF